MPYRILESVPKLRSIELTRRPTTYVGTPNAAHVVCVIDREAVPTKYNNYNNMFLRFNNRNNTLWDDTNDERHKLVRRISAINLYFPRPKSLAFRRISPHTHYTILYYYFIISWWYFHRVYSKNGKWNFYEPTVPNYSVSSWGSCDPYDTEIFSLKSNEQTKRTSFRESWSTQQYCSVKYNIIIVVVYIILIDTLQWQSVHSRHLSLI